MASPSPPVEPLRISKGTPVPSPRKNSRPLSEIAPSDLEKRRNSPSYNQATRKMVLNGDSSPFQSSPFNASAEGNSSPRLFWQGRDPATPTRFNAENLFNARGSSPSPIRRSSIEKLQRASRVKNSTMYAREQKLEYDPTTVPTIERPLAKHLQGNAYGGAGLEGFRSAERNRPLSLQRSDSQNGASTWSPGSYSPSKTPLGARFPGMNSPSREQLSPTKSSMSSGRFNGKASFDADNDTWSEEGSGDERELPSGRGLHRYAKSVTFDAAPPQINEYDMATPDISSIGTGSRRSSYDSGEDDDEDSYNQGGDDEADDSFDDSLEDTDKTPVVGPEDWRHTSSGSGHGILSGRFDDPFEGPDGSPLPDARPTSSHGRPTTARTDSAGSNGDHRPLPPLPFSPIGRSRSDSGSPDGLSAAGERAAGRGLPSPPPVAPVSQSDIQAMSGTKMSLEERLRLMMIQDEEKPKTAAEEQRERRMRRGAAREKTAEDRGEISIHEDEDTLDDLPGLGSYQLPPRISRESILRKVNGQEAHPRESDYNFSSPMPSSSPERQLPLDPDTPIPTIEHSFTESDMEDDDDTGSIIVKTEVDSIYGSPDAERHSSNESVIRHSTAEDEDEESRYSDPSLSNRSPEPPANSNSAPDEDGPLTPRAHSPISLSLNQINDSKTSLPDFAGFSSLSTHDDFKLSMQSYMSTEASPLPDDVKEPELAQMPEYFERPETPELRQIPSSVPEYDGTGWGPEEDDEPYPEPGTPESIIHHPPPTPSPVIPERIATVRANGTKLKTRPSATPADLVAMRDQRRHISGDQSQSRIASISERRIARPLSLNGDNEDVEEGPRPVLQRDNSFKKRSLTLDIGTGMDLCLDEDFNRVIETQKVAYDLLHSQSTMSNIDGEATVTGQASTPADPFRSNSFANVSSRKQRGYLMRQNTKIVVASSNDDRLPSRSAGNSPVKKDRPESWTVEPWNGQPRKASGRSSPRKKFSGPVPPLPGRESNVSSMGAVAEEGTAMDVISEDPAERGRLFVKVIGVKDLDLPLPKNEQTWFSLTLDNGVHCVTTAWLELGRTAPIGQEFELVVPNDLEFQLTLNCKLEKPAPKRETPSPAKTNKPSKPSTFSRVFASPKKRKELEMRQKEEEERVLQQKKRDAQAKKVSAQPTAWDLISPLAADDGSFGRSYVCLKDHEARCYGRPYVVDVACFNEWALESNGGSSVLSKFSNSHMQRRAPYKVAKLELQLLFVPKPKGATDDDMPKSMNSCIRELKEAELSATRNWEGHLSQQGGDCPFWRRRFFRLSGSKLTSYHESTRQPRATINLANACKLIDDRRALTQKETTTKGGKRRRSGFAEDEEGYMYVAEGFRIRFNNGEVIDFYADTTAEKDNWMKVLDACVGKEGDGNKLGWCQMVLKREESLLRKTSEGKGKGRHHQRTKSHIV